MAQIPKDVELESIKVVYSQPCDKLSENIQEITFETGDNGGGKYIVISTERWAVDSTPELVQLVENFMGKIK